MSTNNVTLSDFVSSGAKSSGATKGLVVWRSARNENRRMAKRNEFEAVRTFGDAVPYALAVLTGLLVSFAYVFAR